jgi:hypothetical protein
MINRIIAFTVIICLSCTANASGWDAFMNCLTDPCNCGISDKRRIEKWGDEDVYKGDKNYICAPWNKAGGRDDHSCLAGQDYPGNFIPIFQVVCAESTKESNFFEPKIHVRTQTCNALACWPMERTLSFEGQCKTFPGGYGLPLTRMCARVAVAPDPIGGTPGDLNYSEGEHLDFEGIRQKDELIIGMDGQPVIYHLPKLCLYLDPAFIGSGENGIDIDLIDLNPDKQPVHKTMELHPVIKVIIFFFDIATQTFQSPFVMLASLFDMLIIGGEGPGPFTILANMLNYVGFIVQMVGLIIIEILKSIGQINRVVSPNDYGCAIIPLAPFPPPFCPKVAPLFPTASTQAICATSSDGFIATSTEKVPCVVSNLTNNFIRNAIRVGYDKFVPICKNNEDPMETDACVVIENLDSFASAKSLHLVTLKKDILKPCDQAVNSEPCVKSMIPHTCSVSANGCQDGFRITYSSNIGKYTTPSNYFRDDLSDCPSIDSVSCQKVWGINVGEFVDVSLLFPSTQTPTDIGPISTTFSIASNAGVMKNFSASIVRTTTLLDTYEFTQNPEKICVFVGANTVVGCQLRAPFSSPSVYNCSSGAGGISCVTDYFKPSFIASVSSGADSISALIEPLTMYDDPSSTLSNASVNFAGYEFNGFVTGDTFLEIPFSGPNSLSAGTIHGKYKYDVTPVNDDGSINNDAIYIKDLEYINGAYYRGGKYACLSGTIVDRCPTDTKMCVLASLDNNDIVDCSKFITKAANYAGFIQCPDDISDCNLVDNLSHLSGGGKVDIYTCSKRGYSCYVSPDILCSLTYDAAGRIDPSPSYGVVIPASQYYALGYSFDQPGSAGDAFEKDASGDFVVKSKGSSGYYFDKKVSALRNKTSIEMNLCTPIPQPTCKPAASSGGNSASWSEASIGEYSTGSCSSGVLLKPKRYCLIDSDNKTLKLEDLGPGPECGIGCAVINTYSDADGNATWTSALVGTASTGKCRPGWTAVGALSRICQPGSPPSLSPLLPGQKCVAP